MQERANRAKSQNSVYDTVDALFSSKSLDVLERSHSKEFSLIVAEICKGLGVQERFEYGNHPSKTKAQWRYFLRVSSHMLAEYENADGYNELIIDLSTSEHNYYDTIEKVRVAAKRAELSHGDVLLEDIVETEYDFRDSYVRKNPLLTSRSLNHDGSFSNEIIENDGLSFITTVWDEIVLFDERLSSI